MEVSASSPRALKSQKMVLEMLLSDMPDVGYKWTDGDGEAEATGLVGQHGELSDWLTRLSVEVRPELKALRRQQPRSDISHPAMAVNLDACIQCNRCVRACREAQVNDVIGYAMRGDQSAIVFDLNDPTGDSTCVACGECVQACPTGALMPKTQIGSQAVDKKVDSVCPFCGVGCLLSYNVKDNLIVSVDGRDGPANHSRLCVKGRFGFDYVHSPQRLTKPLIRKSGVPKDLQALDSLKRNSADWSSVLMARLKAQCSCRLLTVRLLPTYSPMPRWIHLGKFLNSNTEQWLCVQAGCPRSLWATLWTQMRSVLRCSSANAGVSRRFFATAGSRALPLELSCYPA